RERFGSQLESSLNTSRQQGQASESRGANLRQDESDNSFNQTLSRLKDAQQTFALINRSAQTAQQAAAALEKAAASGNQQEIQQALSLVGRTRHAGNRAA